MTVSSQMHIIPSHRRPSVMDGGFFHRTPISILVPSNNAPNTVLVHPGETFRDERDPYG